jgi:tetratricopeptide (TPR) repeat protein
LGVKKALFIAALLAVSAVAVALAYQAAARDRDYRALLTRGDTALRDEQTFGAIEAYSGAIALRPDSMLPHLRRGESYRRRGELEEAARDFRAAASLDPTATRPLEALGDVLYELKRFERASEAYIRNLRVDDRSAGVSYKLALARYRGGDIDSALTAVASTLRLNDRLPDATYLLGLCLRDEHRTDEALEAFGKTVALAPGYIAAREELADLYGSTGRHEEEIDQLQMIASLDRDHVERQVTLGLAQARAGHDEMAVLTLGGALERTPGQPLVYRALGQVWLDRAQVHGDRVYLSKALEALGRGASGPDATSDILTLYGRALLLDEQFEAAERALQQASTRYPLEPASLELYATVAERQGHLGAGRQALIDYAGLVADDADGVAHATRIASLSVRLNDSPTAVSWLERALRMVPDDVRLFAQLADAQIRAGDGPAAQTTIARGLEKEPTNGILLALSRRAQSGSRPKAQGLSPQP